MCVWRDTCVLCSYVYIYVMVHVLVGICWHRINVDVYACVCMYVCIYVSMYSCMYACMYVWYLGEGLDVTRV